MRQVEFWNDYAGPSWARHASDILEIGPLGVSVHAGDRVLDLGCGTGDTTRALAELGATVVGVDFSAPMLAAARARCADLDRVSFVEADLATFTTDEPFDLAYSRMCLMLLEDPVPALANVRAALRPGGRLVATVFRDMADNPWLPAVVMGAAPHVGPMPPLPLPGEPGPFAWSDPDLIATLLDAAGFSRVRVEASNSGVPLGSIEALIELGPAGGAYRASPPSAHAAARDGVAALLARFNGVLPTGIWIVTATA
jgi:SAM-dependent methyltransferase